MARRGRPRHPDILTPREWDVLALLREGLTNDQIAQRLDITERTAKFHVAEILSKLGVATREEAAAWEPQARPAWWLAAGAPFAFLWRRAAGPGLKAFEIGIGAALVAGVAAGIALLAVMLIGRGGGKQAAVVEGERLAFSFQGSIYTVRPDGSDLSRILKGSSGEYSAPEFSPDGNNVAYIIDRKRVGVGTSDFSRKLSDSDLFLDETPPTPIASNFSMGPVAVHWSPDGQQLLVTRQRLGGSGASDVVLMDPDGGNQKIVLQSGMFIEATWSQFSQAPRQPGDPPPPLRIIVVGKEDGVSAVAYDLEGTPVGPALPSPSAFYAVASQVKPHDESVLVRSTLGSPEPFGPIVWQGTGEPAIIAGGCGAAWSPSGNRIAYYDGFGIAIKTPDASPDDRRLIVTNEQLGLASSTQANTGVCGNLGADAIGISWVAAASKTYRASHVGLEFAYPASWIEDAADAPFRQCSDCAVFGPPTVLHPRGIRFFFAGRALDGCGAMCFAATNGRVQQGAERRLSVGGRDAAQVEILSTPPLGYTNQTGDSTPFHEVWTLVPIADSGILLVAFYRDADEPAKQETLAAYGLLLKSLIIR